MFVHKLMLSHFMFVQTDFIIERQIISIISTSLCVLYKEKVRDKN